MVPTEVLVIISIVAALSIIALQFLSSSIFQPYLPMSKRALEITSAFLNILVDIALIALLVFTFPFIHEKLSGNGQDTFYGKVATVAFFAILLIVFIEFFFGRPIKQLLARVSCGSVPMSIEFKEGKLPTITFGGEHKRTEMISASIFGTELYSQDAIPLNPGDVLVIRSTGYVSTIPDASWEQESNLSLPKDFHPEKTADSVIQEYFVKHNIVASRKRMGEILRARADVPSLQRPSGHFAHAHDTVGSLSESDLDKRIEESKSPQEAASFIAIKNKADRGSEWGALLGYVMLTDKIPSLDEFITELRKPLQEKNKKIYAFEVTANCTIDVKQSQIQISYHDKATKRIDLNQCEVNSFLLVFGVNDFIITPEMIKDLHGHDALNDFFMLAYLIDEHSILSNKNKEMARYFSRLFGFFDNRGFYQVSILKESNSNAQMKAA